MSDDENSKSSTIPTAGSDLRTNGFVVIKGRPCKIVELSTSKTGKHGHSKIHVIGIDIFTAKKIEDIVASSDKIDAPVVRREDYQLDGIDNGYLLLSDNNGNPKTDVAVPEGELGASVMEHIDTNDELVVTIISAMGEEACIGIRPMK